MYYDLMVIFLILYTNFYKNLDPISPMIILIALFFILNILVL